MARILGALLCALAVASPATGAFLEPSAKKPVSLVSSASFANLFAALTAPKTTAAKVAPAPKAAVAKVAPATKAAVAKAPAVKAVAAKVATVAKVAKAAPAVKAVVAKAPAVKAAASKATPVVVPLPADADAQGFPQLPSVSHMLLAASSTVKALNSQAGALEARVAQAEKASEKKILRQKQLFEKKLSVQEKGNLAALSQNQKISDAVDILRQNIDHLKKHGKELRANNHVMLMELKLMKAKLATASQFTDDSMAISDEAEQAPKSFLQMSSVQKPEEMLDVLMKDVTKLRKDEQDSEKSLKQHFMKDYKVGSKRHAALFLQHKALEAARVGLQAQQAQLEKEETRLFKVRSELEHRLHNLGSFLQSLTYLAKAPVSEVPAMLKNMPKNVPA